MNWTVNELNQTLKKNPAVRVNKKSMDVYNSLSCGDNAPAGNDSTHKFGAKPEHFDGHFFASQAEKERYCELKLLKLAHTIKDFKCQPRYPLNLPGDRIKMTYVGDFEVEYFDGHKECEDVKGVETPVFRRKAKLFVKVYPEIKLILIKSGGKRMEWGKTNKEAIENGKKKRIRKAEGSEN
jgi:hypothetical protein